MDWRSQLNGDSLSWLLEPENPGVRYLALRDLLDLEPGDKELCQAQKLAHTNGPIAAILDRMNSEGYWSVPGHGYNPKYFSTVWSMICLAQLGASIKLDGRIERACSYLLDHTFVLGGQFTTSGTASGTADCLQGNLCWALLTLGCEDDRLQSAYDWMARSVTGEGIAPMDDRQAQVRYYAAKCGANFACGANNKLPCAWGATKVMLAFSNLPAEKYSPVIVNAIRQGIQFFFSVDPASAGYPCGYSDKPSGNWWKFGFPVFYVTDLLQIAEALTKLGMADDHNMQKTLEIIRNKQDTQGRWLLEYDYSGKTWVEIGEKNSLTSG